MRGISHAGEEAHRIRKAGVNRYAAVLVAMYFVTIPRHAQAAQQRCDRAQVLTLLALGVFGD
jgi:hypothetical protein